MKSDQLTERLMPVVVGLGYELVGCEYLPQGTHSLLRVYIDSEEGITVDDCAKVSGQVSAVLDVEEPIKGHYTLEVSSPGIERPLFSLADYQRFIGQRMKIRLHYPVDGRRKIKGFLQQVDGEELTILIDDQEIKIPFAAVAKGKLFPEF